MKNNNMIIMGIVLAVVFGAGGFFAGMQYQKSQRVTFAGQFGGANGQRQFVRQGGGPNARGGTVMGEILSTDDKSITVKLMDGSSKIVILSSSTTINKAATGTKEDLKTGERVAVFGSTNSDGSVTAQSVQLNPTIRGFGGTPQPTK